LVPWLAAITVLAAGCRIGFGPADATADVAPDEVLEDPLVSRGLVVRYFLDEAPAGQTATVVRDAVDPALDLPMRYDTGDDPLWFEAPSGRGLRFPAIELDGGACAPIAGTKILTALNGSTTGTLEVVAEMTAGSVYGSRLLHIGLGSEWAFSLGFSTVMPPTSVWFGGQFATTVAPSNVYRFWPLDVAALGRTVLTLVYDSREVAEADRVRLYVNGVAMAFDPTQAQETLVANDPIAVRADEHLCVGNRFIGGRTPVGSISYAALYAAALLPSEVQTNVARLVSRDDR
jgi:hypothetical protein